MDNTMQFNVALHLYGNAGVWDSARECWVARAGDWMGVFCFKLWLKRYSHMELQRRQWNLELSSRNRLSSFFFFNKSQMVYFKDP